MLLTNSLTVANEILIRGLGSGLFFEIFFVYKTQTISNAVIINAKKKLSVLNSAMGFSDSEKFKVGLDEPKDL